MATFFVNKERVDIAPAWRPTRRCCGSCATASTSPAPSTAAAWRCAAPAPCYVDGQPVRSCQTPLSALKQGADITTIEGLKSREGQAVQAAWQKLDVPQCGYCQSGQIMSAAALLAKNKRPTDADIDAAMAGNICRCATYVRIRAAIKEAAKSLA